ncbi:MarR family winged helix-turn-helix transcriptional regulator [Paramicrobacterium fandaimingii]|uniref:MarR family winged helix-turn-helix transcriptional regulator n=1 Tax=Paramicrobacterium fandaimingii TaxID=2708079 RepID=UPI00142367D5|nr:MarR family transcriptional regulator [Microbacterium fandaimingii]
MMDPENTSSNIYALDASDPQSRLIDRSGLDDTDVRQISELMGSLGNLRDAEQRLSEASLRYMKLNQTDMRALHYLIVAQNRQQIATPGAIATHLGISTASTTKLLDRLEKGAHITRQPHPHDRRALAISITPETREAAMATVGRQQAKRFYAAARLSPAERTVVMRFLNDMANEIGINDLDWARPDSPPE